MSNDERQFLLTAAWMFMRHGQPSRARAVCAALVDDNPRDGVASVALAELMLDSGEATRAIETLRAADVPPSVSKTRPPGITEKDFNSPNGMPKSMSLLAKAIRRSVK